jgi:HEAT repeat protein
MQYPRIGRVAIFALICLPGCSKSQPPLAGGKPPHYWIEALHDPDARLRQRAAFKLGNVGPAEPAALPALTSALQDHDPAVRCEAILALVKFGPTAQTALPTLTALQSHDPNPRVRQYAAKALEKLREK